MNQIPPLDWPDDVAEVECIGFSDGLIYDLMVGIDHNRVEFVSHTQNSWYHTYTFNYLGFRYELETERESAITSDGHKLRGEETYEVPYRLCKIARLGVNDDGDTTISETYPIARAKPPASKYEGNWGTF